MTALFDTPAFTLSHDTDNGWLYAEWRGSQDSVSSSASCTLILHHSKAIGITKLFCDSSQALNGWDELGQWVSTQYLPQLANCGVCAIAWVNARDWTTKASILRMLQETTQPCVVLFEHVASAYEWLHIATFPCSAKQGKGRHWS